MQNKRSSYIMRLLLTLLTVIGWQTGAWAVDVVTLSGASSANNIPLEDGKIYTISSNVTIQGAEHHNALAVNAGATVTIYIPKGKTLTVKGGNAAGTIGAGAGIYVPSSSTLIITGEGTLNVSGGNGANGGNGGDGGQGYIDSSGGYYYGHAGSGGSGGYGGGGSAAAIGGYGGDGHGSVLGPNGPTRRMYDFLDSGHGGSGKPSPTIMGYNGGGMGKVYVLGSVKVNASQGDGGAVAGSAGKYTGVRNTELFTWGSPWWRTRRCTAGPGGPGGGGGSGYKAMYGIGGGAPGAQCGASGSTGDVRTPDVIQKDHLYFNGGSGSGGKGYKDGIQAAPPSDIAYYNESKGGSQSSEVANHGDHGTVYTVTGGSRFGRTCSQYTVEGVPNMVKKTVNLDACGGSSSLKKTTWLLGVVPDKIGIPEYNGRHFLGYYTKISGGERIIKPDGTINDAPTSTKAITLYAHWTTCVAYNETTDKVYIGTPQNAFDDARKGDVVDVYVNWSENLTIDKAISVNLNGNSFGEIKVTDIGKDTVRISNGKMDKLKGVDGFKDFASGAVVCNNLDVDVLYADGHSVIINSGNYANVRNVTKGDVSKLGNVTIKGDDTFVGQVNKVSDMNYGPVTLIGGNYTSDPADADNNASTTLSTGVSVGGSYEVVKLTQASEDAPSKDYIYKVALKRVFANYITLRTGVNTFNTGYNPKKNYKVTCHFSLNSIDSGYNTIFGSSEEYVGTCHKGFGLYVDSEDNSFVFAAGTEFQRSPAGLAKVNQDYYVTISDRYFRIDTVADASSDYYHKEIVQYQFRENNSPITIGGMTEGGLPEVHNMNLYSFAVYDGEVLLSDFRPAYGYQKADPTKDFWLYDIVKNEGRYDWNGNAVPYGAIGECTEHPAYRIKGDGAEAVRMCVICGKTSKVEEFVQSTGTILKPQEEPDARYEYHYASLMGERIEYTETVATVPTLRNMKLFGCKVLVGDEVKHNYVPRSVCGSVYFYDEVTGKYEQVYNSTPNFSLNQGHDMADVEECDGIVSHRCRICGKRNKVDEKQVMAFNTGISLNKDMEVKLCFKVNELTDNEYGVYILGQWSPGSSSLDRGNICAKKTGDNEYKLRYNYPGGSVDAESTFKCGKDYWISLNVYGVNKMGIAFFDESQKRWIGELETDGTLEQYENLWLGSDNSACMTANTRWGHISINECIIYKDKKEISHLYPSQYGKRPRMYDAVSGKAMDFNVKSDVTLTDENYTAFATILPCEEHEHLSSERHEKGGAYYRYCMICGEEVKDTRNFVRTNGTAYFKTDITPTITTEVRTDMEFASFSTTECTRAFGAFVGDASTCFLVQTNTDRTLDLGGWNSGTKVDAGRLYNIRYTKNAVGLYTSATASSSFKDFKSSTTWTSDTFKSPGEIYLGGLKNCATGKVESKPSDIIFYDFNIIENGYFKRRYMPAKRNGQLGLYEVATNTFLKPEYTISGSGETIDKSGWKVVSYDSQQNDSFSATKAIDGDQSSSWRVVDGRYPHTLVVDMGKLHYITAFTYLNNTDYGRVGDYEFYVSSDGKEWGTAVITGQFQRRYNIQKATLKEGVVARYFKFIAKSEITGSSDMAVYEIGAIGHPEPLTGVVNTCEEHLYCDYTRKVEENEEVWQRTCRICGATDYYKGSKPFIANNGVAWFSTEVTATDATRIEADIELLGEKGEKRKWSWTKRVGSDIRLVTDRGIYHHFRNANIYSIKMYEGNTLTHHYLPSRWNGSIGVYDVVTDKFTRMAYWNAASAYVPTCQYHRYFKLDTKEVNGVKTITKHCKLCDAHIAMNGIKVDSQDVLKNYLYNGDSLTISVEMLDNETGETVVTTDKQYPEIKESALVFGVAIMDEGKLVDYFVPAIRKNGEMGMFNAAKEKFINIPNAVVYISDCAHSYYRNDYEAGEINTHCYVCDETVGTIGYYKDITYNAHGGRGSDLVQRITSLKKDAETTILANPFTYGAHFFAGWNTEKAPSTSSGQVQGTAYKPGDKMPVGAFGMINVTLYAQWNDGFICNGDTLEVNAKNTADIHIIDDDFNNFEATGEFTAKNISYSRVLDDKTKTWGTFCLPFPIESDENMQLYTVNRLATRNIQGADVPVLLLDSCQTIAAGEPCIYHINNRLFFPDDILTVSASNVTVGPDAKTHEGENINFTGTYRYITFECEKNKSYYAIQNDHFWRVKSSITVRPFRAYLHTPESSSPAKVMLWTDPEEATAVRTVSSEDNGPCTWYDTNGIPVETPVSGNIYIIKYKSGKTEKVLVK